MTTTGAAAGGPDVRREPVRRSRTRFLVDGALEFGMVSGGPLPPRGAPLAGAPDPSPPFVLVHGVGMSRLCYARVQRLLAPAASVHGVDMPGFGGSRPPGRDVSVPEMARALGAVLDAEGVRRPILVGHSMGTQWVLELALQRPEDVAGVVMIGPVVDDAHPTFRAQAAALALDSARESPRVNLRVTMDYFRSRPTWFAAQVRQMLRYPTRRRAAGLAVPLLVVRGGRDPIAGPEWCARLRDTAPRARAVVVPAGAHHAEYTHPRAVASALLAFAGSLPGGAP